MKISVRTPAPSHRAHNESGRVQAVNFQTSDDMGAVVSSVFSQVFGARIDLEDAYRERYLLDFIISRLEGVHALVNLGVHVNIGGVTLEEQEKFLECVRRGVVGRAVQLELPANATDSGALIIAASACVSFLFDNAWSEVRAAGIRFDESNGFQFFDLEQNVRRLRQMEHEAEHKEAGDREGDIVAYFANKGFGFIEAEDGSQKFFFHIANVNDEELRLILPSYDLGERIPVTFSFGGSDGRKYPKAIDVGLVDDEY